MILVTGASGLIGGALARKLRSEGFQVWTPGRDGKSGDFFDLNDVAAIRLPHDLDTAFLCAWRGGVAEAESDPEGTHRANVEGNLELAAKLKDLGVDVVFLSTSLVFSGADTSATAAVSPCCTYGEQKASVEKSLEAEHDAIVRVTKVGETLMPRLSDWATTLRDGGTVAAAKHMRVAPVMLDEAVRGLVSLARQFQPGTYQMSAREDHSYFDLAQSLSTLAGGTVVDDPHAGCDLFHPFPASGKLDIAAPSGVGSWPVGQDHAQRLVQAALS